MNLKFLFSGILLLTSLFSTAQISSEGLEGYWQFNDNALDHSGNQNHGTINGTILPATDRFDISNGAFAFDKIDDWIRVENNNQLNINGSNSLSISAWVKVHNFPASGEYPGILSKWGTGGSADDQYTLHLRPGGLLAFGLSDTHTFLTTDMIEEDQWCLVTGVYDPTLNKSRIYINDSLVAEMDIPSGYQLRSTMQFVEIGANGSHLFDGLLDDVRLYSRALDPEEVQALYSSDPYAPPLADSSLGTRENPALNAAQLQSLHPGAATGFYWLNPDGYGGVAPFEAFCDMTTEGGGWTLALLSNSSVATCPQPNWKEAVNNVNYNGTLSDDITAFDMFLGVSYWNDLGTKMRLDMGAGPATLSHRAVYDFTLDESSYYALNMSNEQVLIHTDGTASPGMYTYHNGSPLSTRDADHDANYTSCANNYNGAVWWYNNCWSGNFWGGGGQVYQDAPYWTGSAGEYFDYGSIWIKGSWTAEPASVTTNSVTDTGLFSARIYGTITSYGNTLPEAHGICWNTTGNPQVTDNFSDEGIVESSGSFQSMLENLEPNTTYFARSWVQNAAGTVYGEEIQFTTLPDTVSPVVICKDTSLYLNASGKLTPDPSLFDNGSNDNHEIDRLYLQPSIFSGSDIGENTVWLYAEDVAGNLDSCSAILILEDTLSPVAVAGNAMESPLLWNTLRSKEEVENSINGADGSLVGTVSFDSIARYGRGITPHTGNAGSGVDFPVSTVNPDSGSIELWAKFYDIPTPYSHGVYGFVNANHWSHNVLSFTWYNPDRLQFVLNFNGTSVTSETFGFVPELNTPVHLACVWNRTGIGGSEDYMRIYVNDSLVASNSTENTWGTDNSSGDFRVATTWDNNFSVSRYSLENIKIWESSRTGFLSTDMEITEWDTARFTALSSYDNHGIKEYQWSFNDGQKDTVLYGINPEYRFNINGNYRVVLQLTDSSGNTGSDTLDLKVNVRDVNLRASSGAGGEISPAGDTLVQNHSIVEYSLVPETGYYISDITLDELSIVDSAEYSDGEALLSLEVNNNHVIHAVFDETVRQWPEANDIQYGQSLSQSSLFNDSTRVQGRFEFKNPEFIPGDIGTHSIEIIFIPDDTSRVRIIANTTDINVLPADQTIVFDPLDERVCGENDFLLNASASSGLDIEFSSSDTAIALVKDNSVEITGVGTVLITARQPGNNYYNPAPEVSQELIVGSVPFEITEEEAGLTVNNAGYTYQWYNCDTGTPIPGETDSSYTAEESGNYAVILTRNSCTDTSSCYMVVVSNVNDNSLNGKIELYPNPTNQNVWIQSDFLIESITLLTIDGVFVEKYEPRQAHRYMVDLSSYQEGTYIIRVKTPEMVKVYRVIRF